MDFRSFLRSCSLSWVLKSESGKKESFIKSLMVEDELNGVESYIDFLVEAHKSIYNRG